MTSDADEDLELICLNYIDIFTSSHLELLEFLSNNEIDLKAGNWAKSLDAKIHEAITSNPKFNDMGDSN